MSLPLRSRSHFIHNAVYKYIDYRLVCLGSNFSLVWTELNITSHKSINMFYQQITLLLPLLFYVLTLFNGQCHIRGHLSNTVTALVI